MASDPVLELAEELHEIGIPSWSWASKVGEVYWWKTFGYATESIATIRELPKLGCKELRVLSSYMGIPRLKASHRGRGHTGGFYALENTGEMIGEIQLDSQGPTNLGESEEPDYYIVPLVVVLDGGTPRRTSGLVLSRVAGDPGLLQREGVIDGIALGYFDGRDQEMICII